MARQLVLEVETRETRGKGPSRRMRSQDIIPGIYYSKDENIPVQVKEMPLVKAYRQLGSSQVFELEIKDSGKSTKKSSLIKNILFHPVKNKVLHVDFHGIDLDKELKVQIPVQTTGKAAGEDQGGVLLVFRDHIEVRGLPVDIPHEITLDVTDLEINESIQIEDVKFPKGVSAVFEDNFAVVGVAVPAVEKEEEPEEGEEGAEDEAAEGAEGEASEVQEKASE